jgi:hypothetical protein
MSVGEYFVQVLPLREGTMEVAEEENFVISSYLLV